MGALTIAYSRGRGLADTRPQQRTAPDFDGFVAALDADRAPSKDRAPYVCGPLNGAGARCAAGVLPRRWLALDFDKIDPDVLPDLRMWLARFRGVGWPTHSSRPDAPRERAIIELDREVTREEGIAIGEALAADLREEFGQSVVVDLSTCRGEQPVFVPPPGVTLAKFLGDPLRVDDYLAAATKAPQGAPERAQSGDRDEDVLQAIRRGEGLHDAILRFVGRLAAKGLDAATVRAAAVGLLEHARRARGARVDELAGAELDRMVDGAMAKFSRPDSAPPLDLFRERVAPALDAGDFPPLLAEYAGVLARAAGHDPGAYLMAGLGAAAGAMGDHVRLLLDSTTSWFESARLWILLLGAPGTAKTPAIRAAMAPLFDLHRELRAEYARATAALAADEPRPPLPAVFVNDATIEKLSEVLADNPRGIVCVFEELDSWIGSHDCYRGGQGSKDRGEWLRLFDGGPHQVDRIKRGSFFVPNWGVSILGATTPAGLRRHAKDLPPDGLIQRFLPVMVRPMAAPDRTVWANEVRRAGEAFADRLRELHAAGPGVVRLSREAAEVFEARHAALRDEIPAVAALGEPFAGHYAKHAALLARAALTMHGIETGRAAPEVALSGETMRRAERLLRKLARHALALFDALDSGDSATALAQAAGRAIVAAGLPEVTRRDLRQHCRMFKSATEAHREAALRLLVDAAWLTPLGDGRQYDGRPARFAVNAEVFERFREAGEDLKARRAKVRAVFA